MHKLLKGIFLLHDNGKFELAFLKASCFDVNVPIWANEQMPPPPKFWALLLHSSEARWKVQLNRGKWQNVREKNSV